MTLVIAQSHIQVYVGGVETDVLPGMSFDATAAQIATLLPLNAIYPVGSTGPVAVGAPSASPLIIGHGAPASNVGSPGQTYINIDAGSIYENLAGTWMLLGYLSGTAGGSSGSGTTGTGTGTSATAAGGGATNTAVFTDPNNAYLVALMAA